MYCVLGILRPHPNMSQPAGTKGGNALELEGDQEKEGFTVYFEEDEKRGVRVARYEAIAPKTKLHIKEVCSPPVTMPPPLIL